MRDRVAIIAVLSRDPHQLAALLKRRARASGFAKCGVAAARPSDQAGPLRDWLDAGMHGEMAWLENRTAERADVQNYLPGARSVVVVVWLYHVELPPTPPGHGRIARYALGEDYHRHLKKRLHELADWLRGETGCETKACVDTAPVLEREWAARAGVAWQGKNTCAIDTELGSYLLLGEIVTTAELAPDPAAVDRCGTCRRCLDACPTGALVEPRRLDARQCISYLTIEHRGEIAEELRPMIGDWLFGCDVCQEVCPWNRRAPTADVPPRLPPEGLDAQAVLDWSDDDYRQTLRHTAVKRVKLPMLKRNAQIVLDNARRATEPEAR